MSRARSRCAEIVAPTSWAHDALLLAFAVRLWLPGRTLLLVACGVLGLAGLVAGVPTGAFEAVLALWVPSTAAVLAEVRKAAADF